MKPARLLPQALNIGDSLRVEAILPTPPDGESWARADLILRRRRETEDRRLTGADQAIAESLAEIDVPAASTAELPDGVYRYQITATSSAGSVRTIEQGVIDVKDPLDPRRNFEERMLDIVEGVLELKMTESGDVSSYTIGDRQINTMPVRELMQLRQQYKEEVRAQRRKGRKVYHYKRRVHY